MDQFVFTIFYAGLFAYWIYCNWQMVSYRIKLASKYEFTPSYNLTLKRLKKETKASKDEIKHYTKLRKRVYWSIPVILVLALTITPLLLWLLGRF